MSSYDETFPMFENSTTLTDYKSCNERSGRKRLIEDEDNSRDLEEKSSKTLRRNMKFHHCFAFVVGCIIGAGIFISPSLVARYTPNLFISMLAWILAGGLALMGALCYCEMVSVVNKTGASYVFILDCYGKCAGFVVNWTNALIFAPCDACILLVTIGLYACAPFFKDLNSIEYLWCSKLVGIVIMFGVAFINCLGAKQSGAFQIIFVTIQLAAFAMILSLGIYSAATTNSSENLAPKVSFNNTISGLKNDFPAFGIALFNALYCFDGYATLAYVVEEAVNPAQTIPLVAYTSIPFVTFVYVMINLACAAVLTHQEMAASKIVVADVAVRVGGKSFLYFMPFVVAICVIPALSAVFYNLPRLIMSSAREGQFPSMFSLIHKERRTPIPAILFLTILTTLLTLCDLSLQTMLQCCNISIWFEYFLAISTILVNRWKRPDVPRTYRTWITTPIIMMVVPVILLVLAFMEKPISTILIIVVMATSVPVYYVFLYKKWLQNSIPNNRISIWLMRKFPFARCEVNKDN